MARFASATTAITTCLSLIAPHMAYAQNLPAPIILAQAREEVTKEDILRARKRAEEANRQQQEDRERKKHKKDKKDKKADKRDGEKGKTTVHKNPTKEDIQKARNRAKEADKEKPRKADKARDDDRRKKNADRDDRQREEAKQRDKKSDAKRHAAAGVTLAGSDLAQRRSRNMGGLDSVLQKEISGGLDHGRLACKSGGTYPCGKNDLLVTPRGVVLERDGNDGFRLAPADKQLYRVNNDGELIDREGRNQRSQAAAEAARETRAARAAALDENQSLRERREERIRDRRRSDEDFRDSLRQERNREASEKDDDDNDLAKALLLGLGAVAVGSMLNNNRQVALSADDRLVVTRPDGSQEVVRDETALLRQEGSNVVTEEFDDGSSRTIVTREDGSKVVTIRDADMRVLRRTLVSADGRTTRLIDDTQPVPPVDTATLPAPVPPSQYGSAVDEAALKAALEREAGIDRRFTLGQIRNIPEVRSLVAPVDIDAITFPSGSSALSTDQAQSLATLGRVINSSVASNPQEMFLIEGHTDTVGANDMNLALSDRRAETVALALTEYFDVPPENLVVQGYGEEFLKIRSEGDIRENRRAAVRRITDLLQSTAPE